MEICNLVIIGALLYHGHKKPLPLLLTMGVSELGTSNISLSLQHKNTKVLNLVTVYFLLTVIKRQGFVPNIHIPWKFHVFCKNVKVFNL